MIKMLIGAVIVIGILMCIDFLNQPEKYGDIMRRFDESRYQHLDY